MAKWDKNPETCLITDKNSENLSFYESECLRKGVVNVILEY